MLTYRPYTLPRRTPGGVIGERGAKAREDCDELERDPQAQGYDWMGRLSRLNTPETLEATNNLGVYDLGMVIDPSDVEGNYSRGREITPPEYHFRPLLYLPGSSKSSLLERHALLHMHTPALAHSVGLRSSAFGSILTLA